MPQPAPGAGPATPAGPAQQSTSPDATVAARASRILDRVVAIAPVDGDDPTVTLGVLRDVATAVDTIVASTTAHARRTRPGAG
ncbi:hypothetical protein ACFRCG_33445 [Embleya sp. NPDC056575]|uniref:hypothetical protein n=1 Tax=Embleya sp. NPDC056575 TaxID=3345869 RepID=UPI0036ABB4AD